MQAGTEVAAAGKEAQGYVFFPCLDRLWIIARAVSKVAANPLKDSSLGLRLALTWSLLELSGQPFPVGLGSLCG